MLGQKIYCHIFKGRDFFVGQLNSPLTITETHSFYSGNVTFNGEGGQFKVIHKYYSWTEIDILLISPLYLIIIRCLLIFETHWKTEVFFG